MKAILRMTAALPLEAQQWGLTLCLVLLEMKTIVFCESWKK